MLRKLLLGLALVWAGYASLREVNEALSGYGLRDRRTPGPLQWRFGMPPVADLARFAAGARPRLPAGSLVAFASPNPPGTPGAADAAFFRYRWAAYCLPEIDLVEYGSAAAAQADYVLAYRLQLPAGSLAPAGELAGGRLYQPATPAPGPARR